MQKLLRVLVPAAVVIITAASQAANGAPASSPLAADFADPPHQWHSRPLWFWNGRLAADKTRAMVAACYQAGYHGMGILPTAEMGVAFMTPEFLDHYQTAIDKAAQLGMKMCLYDEFWFPSGKAGGLLAQKFPEALSKRLDMLALDLTGPRLLEQQVPPGTFMGAVAMDMATMQRRNISQSVSQGKLVWNAPAGSWKVMLFTCVRDGGDGLVNYLDAQAVQRFIQLTYQAYHDKFPQHFGKTIDSAFYDEPGMYHVQGGRAWLDTFNERFRRKFNIDPVPCYPAMFFEDMGPDTAAARNALFGMRAELYAEGFPKTINDWCRKHGIQLTGHVDQEELVNPVIGQSGDMIKAFKYQDIPGIDQIAAYGRASRAYKVVSSAAYNYDRPLVMTECYGAINQMPVANLYKEAIDQFAKGINLMVPHAVWYDSPRVGFPPDLTPDAAVYGNELPAYNQYIGRLQRMLQGGRHVADIGVLYPIATLQAGSWFGPGNPYEGCVNVPEADYMALGETLALNVRRDFTFVHPEVLEESCSVTGSEIRLNHQTNKENYQVFIIPGSRAIHWRSLKKIQQFYDQGGKVIATTRLPDRSAEFGHDSDVHAAIAAMFGTNAGQQATPPKASASSSWAGGSHDPALAIDGNPQTRWNAADGDNNPQWLVVDLGGTQTISKTIVHEAFPRVTGYQIEVWDGAKWVACAKGDSLGAAKVDTFAPVKGSKLRLGITAVRSDSATISELEAYDPAGRNLIHTSGEPLVQTNAKGGKAYFIPSPQPATLKAALDDALPVYDVIFEQEPSLSNGNLSYIHKVVENRQVYFVGNSSDTAVDTFVRLRGKLSLQAWDPHTGKISPCQSEALPNNTTRIHLQLPPVHSLMLVSEPN